jgi:hypothetical protein
MVVGQVTHLSDEEDVFLLTPHELILSGISPKKLLPPSGLKGSRIQEILENYNDLKVWHKS